MKYWPTNYNKEYIREDGVILSIDQILEKDHFVEIICDNSIEPTNFVQDSQRTLKIIDGVK